MLMIFGHSGNVHDPQHQFCLTLDLHDYSKNQDDIHHHLGGNMIFAKPKLLHLENVKKQKQTTETTHVGISLRAVLSILENLEYGINIFKET